MERDKRADMKPNEPIATTKDVVEYVGDPENLTDREYGRICGDGRYWPEESGGKMPRFGADMGYVMGILALDKTHNLNLSASKIVDAVIAVSTADGGKFYMHNDTQGKCGHTYNATLPEKEEDYGLDSDKMQEALNYATELGKTNPEKVENLVLQGEHKERGVLINVGRKKKINHRNGDEQYFVWAKARDEAYVRNILFPKILQELPVLAESGITADEYWGILEKQTSTTARILAKGKPIFEVHPDEEKPEVKQIGIVS